MSDVALFFCLRLSFLREGEYVVYSVVLCAVPVTPLHHRMAHLPSVVLRLCNVTLREMKKNTMILVE